MIPSFPAGSTALVSGSYLYRTFYADTANASASCTSERFLHQDSLVANQCITSEDQSKGAFMELLVVQDAAYAQNSLMYWMTVFYNDSSCSIVTSAPSTYGTNVDGACSRYTVAPYSSAPSSGYTKMGFLSYKPDSNEVAPIAGVFTG
jgi:hypothetical protein